MKSDGSNLFSIIELANSTFSLSNAIFSCSNMIDGLVNDNSKLVKFSSVYPCEYKCTNAILVNSDTMMLCIREIVRAKRISSAANVALPVKSFS